MSIGERGRCLMGGARRGFMSGWLASLVTRVLVGCYLRGGTHCTKLVRYIRTLQEKQGRVYEESPNCKLQARTLFGDTRISLRVDLGRRRCLGHGEGLGGVEGSESGCSTS